MQQGRIVLRDGIIVCFDSFSGALSDLKKKERTLTNVLAALANNPRVSTFEMAEHYRWMPSLVDWLIDKGWVVDRSKDEGFPWHRYELTDAGRTELADSVTTA